MKTTVRPNLQVEHTFGSLAVGEVFRWGKIVFMKINKHSSVMMDKADAISLIRNMSDDKEVDKLEAELIVTEL